jgi:spermidine synthase
LKKKEAGGGISYHVIIQDASDPFYTDSNGSIVILPSHVLYQDEHFQRMHKLLAPNRGVLMFQAETYNIPSNLEEIRNWRRSLEQIGFEHVRYGSISISTYPTGQIGFFVSHAHDGDDEFVCKTHTGMGTSTSTNTCQENSHTSISSLADDKMDMSVWMDWHQIWASYRELRGSTKHYHPRIHRR